MPEMSGITAGLTTTYGSAPSTSGGTVVTTNASTNTKGTWVELVAATTYDAHWIQVFPSWMPGTFNSLVDIGIGASTEQVIIPDLLFSTGGNSGSIPWLFPIFIPAGSRITARAQTSNAASSAMQVAVQLYSQTLYGPGGLASTVEGYGATTSSNGTNVDPGGTANTDSGWVEITSATTRSHRWLTIATNCGDGAIAASTRWLIAIAVGASGQEEVVVSDIFVAGDTLYDRARTDHVSFPLFVPEGTRLSVRVRSSNNTNGDRDIWVRLYGAG